MQTPRLMAGTLGLPCPKRRRLFVFSLVFSHVHFLHNFFSFSPAGVFKSARKEMHMEVVLPPVLENVGENSTFMQAADNQGHADIAHTLPRAFSPMFHIGMP